MVNCGLSEITSGFLLNENLVDSDVPLHPEEECAWEGSCQSKFGGKGRGGQGRKTSERFGLITRQKI